MIGASCSVLTTTITIIKLRSETDKNNIETRLNKQSNFIEIYQLGCKYGIFFFTETKILIVGVHFTVVEREKNEGKYLAYMV